MYIVCSLASVTCMHVHIQCIYMYSCTCTCTLCTCTFCTSELNVLRVSTTVRERCKRAKRTCRLFLRQLWSCLFLVLVYDFSLSPSSSTDHDPVTTGLSAGDGATGISWEVSCYYSCTSSLYSLSPLYMHMYSFSLLFLFPHSSLSQQTLPL